MFEDSEPTAKCYLGIAEINFDQGKLHEALELVQNRVVSVFEQIGDLRLQGVSAGQIAYIVQAKGNLDEALGFRSMKEYPLY